MAANENRAIRIPSPYKQSIMIIRIPVNLNKDFRLENDEVRNV